MSLIQPLIEALSDIEQLRSLSDASIFTESESINGVAKITLCVH